MDYLAAIGLMFILKYGTILDKPREFICRLKFFREMFNCSMCLGFWCGVMVAVVANIATFGCLNVFGVVFFGLEISFLSLVADLIVEFMDEVKWYFWFINEKNKNKIENQDGRGKDKMDKD